jgi:outer membrane protein TolC
MNLLNWRRATICGVLLFILLPVADFSIGLALTIDEAVQLALQRNEDFLVVLTELEKADADVKNAVAGALPHLDFDGRLQRNHEIPTMVFGGETFKLGTNNNLNFSLTLTQPIYLGGKVFSAVKIARIYRKYISEMVRESEIEVVFGVRQAFLGAILSQDYVAVYRDAVATAELNLEMVSKMAAQGVVSDYEVLRAEVEAANLRPQLTQAENRAVMALDELRDLIGMESGDEFALIYQFDPLVAQESFNLAGLQKSATSHRPLLQEQAYYEELRQKAIGVAKSGYRPNISLSSGLNWTYQDDDLDIGLRDFTRSWATTLFISMPLFDGFATSAEVKKARLDHHASQLQAKQANDRVEIEVRSAHLQFQEATERLQAQTKTVEQAEEGLRISRLRYESGVGTQLEVLSAESALTQAKTNFVQATHDAALGVYRLQRVTGLEDWKQLKEL